MNNLTPEVWLEQAELLREIQHLRTAARLLAIGKPGRARASEAALDLAKAREEELRPETQELLLKWSDVAQPTQLTQPTQAPALTDLGDRLLWLVKYHHQH
jgi:hypothetical protein